MELPFISEFKSEQRVIWFVYIKDVFILLGFFVIGYIFKNSVHSRLETVFIIYNLFIGIVITRKSKTNPKKRVYEAILIMLMKDKNIYKPVIGSRTTLGKEKQC